MNKLLANAFRSAADDAHREGKISSDQKHVYFRSGSYCYVISIEIYFFKKCFFFVFVGKKFSLNVFFFIYIIFCLDQGPFCGATDCSCFELRVSFLMGFKSRVDILPALFL